MARRAKTPRFKEFESLSNTMDYFSKAISLPASQGPYEIELGCGRGEFILELARRHPSRQFVGIDIKSDRMWFGARQAESLNIKNLRYVRADAKQLGELLEKASVSGIWLTFPDPYPKKRQAKHRLTHKDFMAIYKDVVEPGGWVRLKTDNDTMFEWSIEEITGIKGWGVAMSGQDLHGETDEDSDWRILTAYERRFLQAGQTINYAEFISA